MSTFVAITPFSQRRSKLHRRRSCAPLDFERRHLQLQSEKPAEEHERKVTGHDSIEFIRFVTLSESLYCFRLVFVPCFSASLSDSDDWVWFVAGNICRTRAMLIVTLMLSVTQAWMTERARHRDK